MNGLASAFLSFYIEEDVRSCSQQKEEIKDLITGETFTPAEIEQRCAEHDEVTNPLASLAAFGGDEIQTRIPFQAIFLQKGSTKGDDCRELTSVKAIYYQASGLCQTVLCQVLCFADRHIDRGLG